MLLPKGGVTWKSAKARLPPWKAILMFLTRTRFLVAVALTGLIVLLWRGITVSTREMSKYVRHAHPNQPHSKLWPVKTKVLSFLSHGYRTMSLTCKSTVSTASAPRSRQSNYPIMKWSHGHNTYRPPSSSTITSPMKSTAPRFNVLT
jgi:hypothetical protein